MFFSFLFKSAGQITTVYQTPHTITFNTYLLFGGTPTLSQNHS